MILDLVRKLSSVGDGYTLSINYSKDGVVTFSVESVDGTDWYSISSTDVMECYNKILGFIDCLEDSNKFFDLLKEIEEEPLGV